MKTINSLVQASLDSKSFSGVILARLHFSSTEIYRYNTSYQSIYWDEDGNGDKEYLGVGNLASVSVLTESNELAAQTIQLTLSGIPNDSINNVLSDKYIGNPCYLWYATLDPTTYAVEGGQTGPILMFAGRMDYGAIEFGETASIIVNVTNRLADWELPRGGRFNDGYQRQRVDDTDNAFKYVQGLQNKDINWGAISNVDPGGNPGGSGPMCFARGTQFIMEDGSTKVIEDIKLGDIMLAGGEVDAVLVGNGYNQDWYNVNGIHVVGSHVIFYNNQWSRVKDLNFNKIEPYDTTYSVCNVNHAMIHESGQVFKDWTEFDYQTLTTWDDLVIDLLNDKTTELKWKR